MARRRKGGDEEEEDPKAAAAGAATATDDDDGAEPDAGDTGDGGDDAEGGAAAGGGGRVGVSGDEREAFDPADEADAIADLSEKEQDERLLDLQRRGFDVSIVRARLNHKKRKQHAQTSELERLQPVKFPDGTQAAGTLDRFEAPFSELGIKDVARKVYGGGTYAILYYDGNHVIKHREVFTVPGKPKSTDEVTELKKTTPPPPAPPDQTGGYTPRFSPERDTENESLREQIRSQDLRTMLAEQDRRHQDQMRILTDAVKSLGEKKSSSLPDIIAAAAPFVPVFAAFVSSRGKDKQDVGELMKAFRDQNNDTLRQMKDAIDTATRGQRNDPMAAATTKLVDLAIAKTLGTNNADPNAVYADIMKRAMPQMLDHMMEVATMARRDDGGDREDDGKLSPKFIFEKAAAMLQPALEQLRNNRGMAAGPASAMPGMPGMPAPYPYPYPYGPPPVQPTPGVYPYGAMPPPSVAPAPPGMVAAPPMPAMPGPASAQPGPASAGAPPGRPVQPVAPNGAPVPTVPVQPEGEPDIHPQLFVLMYQFLQAGKTGADLAEAVDTELEEIAEKKKQGPRMLSDKAIDILEDTNPDLLVDEVLKAAPPQLLQPFLVAPPPAPPGAPQLPPQIAPHVRGFVLEFCKWWNENKAND